LNSYNIQANKGQCEYMLKTNLNGINIVSIKLRDALFPSFFSTLIYDMPFGYWN